MCTVLVYVNDATSRLMEVLFTGRARRARQRKLDPDLYLTALNVTCVTLGCRSGTIDLPLIAAPAPLVV